MAKIIQFEANNSNTGRKGQETYGNIISLDDFAKKMNNKEMAELITSPIKYDMSIDDKRENILALTSKYIDIYYPIIGTHKYSNGASFNGLFFQMIRNTNHLLKCVFFSKYRAKQINLIDKEYILPSVFISLLKENGYFEKIAPLSFSNEIEILKGKYKYEVIDTIQKSFEAILAIKKNLIHR